MADRIHLSFRATVAATALLIIQVFVGRPAAAQSDGSLERLYSQQCRNQEVTQACRTLSDAIKRAAIETTSVLSADAPAKRAPKVVATNVEFTPELGRDYSIVKDWKILGQMAGKEYVIQSQSNEFEDVFLTVRWTLLGSKIELKFVRIPSGKFMYTQYITRSMVDGSFSLRDTDKDLADVEVSDDRMLIVYSTLKNRQGNLFFEWISTGKNFAFANGRLKNGQMQKEFSGTYFDVTGADRGKLNQIAASAFAQRKQMAQESSNDDGMFGRMLGGALVGAIIGGGGEMSAELALAGAQAAANGGNTYQMLTQMGGVAQTNAEASRRQLETSIAKASENDASNSLVSAPRREGQLDASLPNRTRSSQSSASPSGPLPRQFAVADSSAIPQRRQIWGWCYATKAGKTTYMSGVGSRSLNVDEQEPWRAAMEAEFKQKIDESYDSLQCDIDDDADFSYTRRNAEFHNPVRVRWSPN